jgi:hypothetical protein
MPGPLRPEKKLFIRTITPEKYRLAMKIRIKLNNFLKDDDPAQKYTYRRYLQNSMSLFHVQRIKNSSKTSVAGGGNHA